MFHKVIVLRWDTALSQPEQIDLIARLAKFLTVIFVYTTDYERDLINQYYNHKYACFRVGSIVDIFTYVRIYARRGILFYSNNKEVSPYMTCVKLGNKLCTQNLPMEISDALK